MRHKNLINKSDRVPATITYKNIIKGMMLKCIEDEFFIYVESKENDKNIFHKIHKKNIIDICEDGVRK